MRSLKRQLAIADESPSHRGFSNDNVGGCASLQVDHPKRRSGLNLRSIEGEIVVLDRQGGWVHQLNATASLIWSACDGASTIQAIADRLVAAYEVDLPTAITDVRKVIAQLRKLHLLESDPKEQK